MPAKSLLAMAAGVAVLVSAPTAAFATDTKLVKIAGKQCDSGIATSATLSVSGVTAQDLPGIQVWVNTESSGIDATFADFTNDTATYTVEDLDAPLTEATASVASDWNGDFTLEIICEGADNPTITPACDFDGTDPKVLNVKVYNPNPAKTRYSIAVIQTDGATRNRNLSRFAEKLLTVPAHSTEEADFGPIYDGSTFRVTVTGREGSEVTEEITCGIMPGSSVKESEAEDPDIEPAESTTPALTAEPALQLPKRTKEAVAKKPVAGLSNTEQAAILISGLMLLMMASAAFLLRRYHKRREDDLTVN